MSQHGYWLLGKILNMERGVRFDIETFKKYNNDINLTTTIINNDIKVCVKVNDDSKIEFVVDVRGKIYSNLTDEKSENNIANMDNDDVHMILKNFNKIYKYNYIKWLKSSNEEKIKDALKELINFGWFFILFKNSDNNWCHPVLNKDVELTVRLADDNSEDPYFELVVSYQDKQFVLSRKYLWDSNYQLPLKEMEECLPQDIYNDLAFSLKSSLREVFAIMELTYSIVPHEIKEKYVESWKEE